MIKENRDIKGIIIGQTEHKIMCIFVKGCLSFELEYILFRDVIH